MAQPTEEQVLSWLKEHPGFFEKNPQILTEIKTFSARRGTVVSLGARQLEVLQQQNSDLKEELLAMAGQAAANFDASRKMLVFAHELLKRKKPVSPGVLADMLADVFGIDEVAVRILSDAPEDETLASLPCACVPLAENPLTSLLKHPEEAASSAFISASDDGRAVASVIAASKDPARFAPGMAVDFLEIIGSLCAAALSGNA